MEINALKVGMDVKFKGSETCEPEEVHLITNVQTTPAQIQDVSLTATIHEARERKSLLPDEHFVDSGYVDADLLVSSQHDYGVSLIGPVRPDPSWQAKNPVAYDASRFSIDWPSQTVTCPQGQQSKSWTPSKDPGNNLVITVNFGKKTCKECPARSLCTRVCELSEIFNLTPPRATTGFTTGTPTTNYITVEEELPHSCA